MSVNLQKGQKVDLRKDGGGTLRRVMVGLGWDEVQQKGGFFAPRKQDIDCDASAFVCTAGKLAGNSDVCTLAISVTAAAQWFTWGTTSPARARETTNRSS